MQSRLEELALPLRVVTAEPVLALARSAGVDDVLVLRRTGTDSVALTGGLGLGAEWAGDVTLSAGAPPLQAALDRGEPTRWAAEQEQHVLGPYYARHAVLLPVDHASAVLLGAREPLPDDRRLRRAATAAVASVGTVAPAKRLADELEVLTAVRDVMHCTAADVRSTVTHVASSAAAALECEVALLWLPGEAELVVVERGWRLDASREELVAALQQLPELRELPLRVQDSTADPLPGPLGPERGVRSHCVLPLGRPGAGILVLLHTAGAPRGFTDLCLTIAAKVAEAGSVVVQSSVLRAELHRLLRHAETVARRDALTGLSNRLAWDEALTTVGSRVDGGECASVVIVDLNDLKTVNDEHGHDAGDRLLQRAADALSSVARRGDTVARLGGDEFGLLLPGVDAVDAGRVVERLREAFARTAPVGATPLSAAFGRATCDPGGSLRSAAYRADSAMYVDKQAAREQP